MNLSKSIGAKYGLSVKRQLSDKDAQHVDIEIRFSTICCVPVMFVGLLTPQPKIVVNRAQEGSLLPYENREGRERLPKV